MVSQSPSISLGILLRDYRLQLGLIAGAIDGAADRPLQWVHASELEDPTPFMPAQTVLLSTGARYGSLRSHAAARAYVQRLIDAETTALGVAIGVHWERVPAEIVSACDELGLPLLRVPYDTAFIEIVQTAARALDAIARERDQWSLDAQQAVTAASLRSTGLPGAVQEASIRLGRWVAIADQSGRLIATSHTGERHSPGAEHIERLVQSALSRGPGASHHQGIRAETLGRQGRLLGVMFTQDDRPLDAAEQQLLSLLAALSTGHLENQDSLRQGAAGVRRAVLAALRAGEVAFAHEFVGAIGLRPLPRQVTLARLPGATGLPAALLTSLRALETPSAHAAAHRESALEVLLIEDEDASFVVMQSRATPEVHSLLERYAVVAGISSNGDINEVPRLANEAERALSFAHHGHDARPVVYERTRHGGILRFAIEHPDAHLHATGLLAPLLDDKNADDRDTLEALRVWLAHHGQTSPAAGAIGVHRHTLRSRLDRAADQLQLDLDDVTTRAELWSAFMLLDAQSVPS